MASIIIASTLLEEGLSIKWEKRKATPMIKNSRDKSEWGYLLSKGLYGKYGHTLNLENCLFTDLVVAFSVLVGVENCSVDREGEKELSREKEQEEGNPIPDNSVS